jgi:hypothetical protein
MPSPAVTCQRSDLIAAVCNGSWRERFYLDTQQNQTVCVREEDRATLQLIYDDHGEAAAPARLADLPPAERDVLVQVHAVEMDDVRFRKLPTLPAGALLAWQSAFADDLDDRAFQRLLWHALDDGDSARFGRLLALEPHHQQRWQTYHDAQVTRLLDDWAAAESVVLTLV